MGLADLLQVPPGGEVCLVADLARGDPGRPGAQPRLGLRGRVAAELDDGVDRELAGGKGGADPGKPGEGVGGLYPAACLPPAEAVADREEVGHVARPGVIPALAVVGLGDRGEQLPLGRPDPRVELVHPGDEAVVCLAKERVVVLDRPVVGVGVVSVVVVARIG
jgi:hypothetical protein